MDKETKIATEALIQGLFQRYPRDAAKLLNQFSLQEILRILQDEPVSSSVMVFERLDPDIAAGLINKMDTDYFRKLFALVNITWGTSLLSRLHPDTAQNCLALLPPNVAKEYQELMSYPPESAGNLMDPRVTTFREDDSVEDVLTRIRGIRDRRILDVCVVDDAGILVGVIPLQEVAISEPAVRMGDLVQGLPTSIHALSPREEVVELLEKRKLASLPVVDIDGKLLGIIRHDALVTAAQQEVAENAQTMFGAGRDERALSKATFAIRKRLPWLEINLVTAFLAAAVVGLFEETIAKITVLAVFLPVVAGQSGNTGSQALAVTIRGLALREIRVRHWFQIMRKEAAVGFINGVVVALTTSLAVYIWMHSLGLALVIGIAMVFSMVIAGLSGAVIPVILKAFGQDPAQSSSIILTTVTDVVGFMSFLGLATIFATFLTVA